MSIALRGRAEKVDAGEPRKSIAVECRGQSGRLSSDQGTQNHLSGSKINFNSLVLVSLSVKFDKF